MQLKPRSPKKGLTKSSHRIKGVFVLDECSHYLIGRIIRKTFSHLKDFCCHWQKINSEASSRARWHNAEQVMLALPSWSLPMTDMNYSPTTVLLVGSNEDKKMPLTKNVRGLMAVSSHLLHFKAVWICARLVISSQVLSSSIQNTHVSV